MKENNNKQRIVLATVALAIAIILGLFLYNGTLENNLLRSNGATLENISEQQQFSIYTKLTEDMATAKSYAQLFSGISEDENKIKALLKLLKNASNFDFMAFVSHTGDAVNETGVHFDNKDNLYFQRALKGETLITNPYKAVSRDYNMISIRTPIYNGDKVIGVLYCNYNADNLNNMLYSSFDGRGYTYVTTKDGYVVTKTNNKGSLNTYDNLLDTFKDGKFYGESDVGLIRENMKHGKGGHVQISIKGQKILMNYVPIGINEWYIFAVAPNSVISEQADNILGNTQILTFVICAVIAFIMGGAFLSEKRYIKKVFALAFTDELTGEPNFNKFKMDAEKVLGDKNSNYVMILIDIARFSLINKIYGYDVGNQVLNSVSWAIKDTVSKNDLFARVRDDEFVILLGTDGENSIEEKKTAFDKKIRFNVSQVIEFKIDISEGRYAIPREETDFIDIFEKVNFAHKLAKKKKMAVCYYDENTNKRDIFEKEIENKMEAAFKNGEFNIFLQPKYRLEDEKLIGAEALVRWITPDGTMIYPDDFIPLFEENGFVIKLDYYMLEQACLIIHKYILEGKTPFPISVNFSKLHLGKKNFVAEVKAITEKFDVPTHLIELEFTETMMEVEAEALTGIMNRFGQLGFVQSMDDFGKGYSSLGMLRNLPLDVIKLDRSFVNDVSDIGNGKIVLESVVSMVKKLKIKTVAEGVETAKQAKLLREIGCEAVQGYYYAKPMPFLEFERAMKKLNPFFEK